MKNLLTKRIVLVLLIGIVVGIVIMLSGQKAMKYTSTDEYCNSCHIHPHATQSWKQSVHVVNRSGVKVHCVQCHLPPKGQNHLIEKIKAGSKDVYGYLFKDSTEFNWAAKSHPDMASKFTFKSSCINCHANLFPLTLSKKGEQAHLYYTQHEDELNCINCHIDVGHYDPNAAAHAQNTSFGNKEEKREMFTEATVVNKFESFEEHIPESDVAFKMVAIPGGSFKMGSPDKEKGRENDEGPVKEVKVSPFFMAEIEVTWDEYLAFYQQTSAEGRSTDTEGVRKEGDVDAISGATPPYGQPDQGWGLGKRPAITMTWHAAETYCRWLSQVTGKTYRLPTEAEWEYAARGGKEGSYFFEGKASDFNTESIINKIFGANTEILDKHVVYVGNSKAQTQTPDVVEANPFGLKNMLGNVGEFCSDWYSPDALKKLTNGVNNPKGPVSGKHHVVKGGSFKSTPAQVRCAERDFADEAAYRKTDPQMPKSIWWYSDCTHIGFRVVCEFDEKTGK
ncbi:hypothetical protein EMN47_05830 [Prolixibacteraceae bacterium JC049]|nr:hypothetical protein [Prolixibacteraceae bacterium JC049]